MTRTPLVSYAPRPSAKLETEPNMLANVYKFVLYCHVKKEGARPGAPNDAERSSCDGANRSIPK